MRTTTATVSSEPPMMITGSPPSNSARPWLSRSRLSHAEISAVLAARASIRTVDTGSIEACPMAGEGEPTAKVLSAIERTADVGLIGDVFMRSLNAKHMPPRDMVQHRAGVDRRPSLCATPGHIEGSYLHVGDAQRARPPRSEAPHLRVERDRFDADPASRLAEGA